MDPGRVPVWVLEHDKMQKVVDSAADAAATL